MEIIGDDKKLRALYSEAKAADRAATPSFTSQWHQSQAHSLTPRRAFNLSFALVTALLVLTLGSLAVWSMYSSRSHQPREAVKTPPTPAGVAPATLKSPEKPNDKEEVRTAEKVQTPIGAPVHRSVKSRLRKPATQPEAQTIAYNATIDTWQSPTATLLSSPTDGLFKSVPQLNENANEMKSVLPGRSNDKEK
jgi:hypothetical protein